MNERFRELAQQAGFDVERLSAPYPGGFPREDMLALESFAELIVQECIKTVGKDIDRYSEFVASCDFLAGANDALQDAITAIKEKFGVEADAEVEHCPACNAEWSGTSCGLDNCGWIVGADQ